MTVLKNLLSDERGLTLVELILYTLLLAMIAWIAGTILITSLTSQRDITAMGNASNQGQNVANSIEEGVRTASSLAAPTADSTGRRLVARVGTFTSAGAVSWTCRTWLFATDGGVYVKSGSTASAAPANLAASSLTGWLKLAQGVTPVGGSAMTLSAATVSLDFKVAAGTAGGSPAHIVTSVTKLAVPNTTGTGPATC